MTAIEATGRRSGFAAGTAVGVEAVGGERARVALAPPARGVIGSVLCPLISRRSNTRDA